MIKKKYIFNLLFLLLFASLTTFANNKKKNTIKLPKAPTTVSYSVEKNESVAYTSMKYRIKRYSSRKSKMHNVRNLLMSNERKEKITVVLC